MTAAATAEVLQMPANESASNRESEEREIASRKEEAKHHYEHIVRAAALQSRNSLRIGFHAFALKEKKLWGMLGFKDENEARLSAGVKDSTWYNVIRLAEAFRTVPEELFISMKLANASELADLPESKRIDRDWLKWAADEPITAFAKRCDEEMNGKSKTSDTKEHPSTMKMTMPASRQKVIEAGAKKFAEKHGLDPADTSKALELMVVEQDQVEGVTLIGAITSAVQKIKAAKEKVNSGIAADEALALMEKTLDDLVLDFAAALEAAKSRNSEAA